MRSIHLLFVGLLLISLQLSGVVSRKFEAHHCVHSKNCHSHDFQEFGATPLNDTITLSFAVKLRNVEKLFELVDRVSDPKSPDYGNHWTYDQVADLTADKKASQEVRQYLMQFIENKSQMTSSKDGTFIRVTTNIATAEKMLNTRYGQFKSEKTGEILSRTLSFELPPEIAKNVDYVSPTTQFPTTFGERTFVISSETFDTGLGEGKDSMKSTRAVNGSITPQVLRSFYNIPSTPVKKSKATQSAYEAVGQNFSPSDLEAFQRYFELPLDPVDKFVGKNYGETCPTNPNSCFEANLDLQYMTAIAQVKKTSYWSSKKSFLNWIEDVASSKNPPLVHSISYGQYEDQTDPWEQERFSEEAARLGLRGVTIVVASGDDGVSNWLTRNNPSGCGFHVNFPANVPYVLTVGATMGPESSSSSSYTEEVACQSDKGGVITTGGGFSRIFDRPSFQSSHVQQYLSSSPPSSSFFPPLSEFNVNGRGIPDVAIAGFRYQIVVGGKGYFVSGTSASAPVFAAILSLANDRRLSIGKSSLGFVNPVLYQLFNSPSSSSIFNDILTGDNRCAAAPRASVPPTCCQYGFSCRLGWDPVTGLGSVNAARLIEALVSL